MFNASKFGRDGLHVGAQFAKNWMIGCLGNDSMSRQACEIQELPRFDELVVFPAVGIQKLGTKQQPSMKWLVTINTCHLLVTASETKTIMLVNDCWVFHAPFQCSIC